MSIFLKPWYRFGKHSTLQTDVNLKRGESDRLMMFKHDVVMGEFGILALSISTPFECKQD
ncbi:MULTISPECIES: hypothetical protein [Shewanella]|uniref:hypothetical protein n=1 Tax=Shewanella TaxID=22 RepID=UPI000970F8C3|nr:MULTISPECIES: hypothetical protein [Shewanella]MCL1085123.1 hypothetical protein [Shewanella glacialipiscicola]MCU7996565.1 hypothetical protein [Shewanella glacialipiscicola]MCU8027878.1 hypothetical protein [Shewanella glacialipiscicola]